MVGPLVSELTDGHDLSFDVEAANVGATSMGAADRRPQLTVTVPAGLRVLGADGRLAPLTIHGLSVRAPAGGWHVAWSCDPAGGMCRCVLPAGTEVAPGAALPRVRVRVRAAKPSATRNAVIGVAVRIADLVRIGSHRGGSFRSGRQVVRRRVSLGVGRQEAGLRLKP